jgi:SAM-dependent methyltransferase
MEEPPCCWGGSSRSVGRMPRPSLLSRVRNRLLPESVRRWWRRVPGVDMGDLRHPEPVGRMMGVDRGLPICRFYIERFLAANAELVHGRVLEAADDTYTRRFGGERVTERAVLHAVEGNSHATIVGDLTTGEGIPVDQFDAAILTQVLQCVFDVGAAVRSVHRLLAPGGTALVTVPSIAPRSRYDAERWGEYWHFSEQSVQRLFEPVFGAANVRVASYGNVVAAHAYLAGMAAEELRESELLANDPDYAVVITAIATRR